MYVAVTIKIDRRKTLGDLKKKLEEIVQVPATEFKVSFAGALVILFMCPSRSTGCIPIIKSTKSSDCRIPYRVCPTKQR